MRTIMRTATVSTVVALCVTAGLTTSARPAAAAAATPTSSYGTYVQVATNDIPDTTLRQALARRYGLVILRGNIKSDLISDLRQARTDIKLFAYEQSAALHSTEAAAHPEYLAHDCSGNTITHGAHTLADLTNPDFRTWRKGVVAAEVA